jgi:hypothetical protein
LDEHGHIHDAADPDFRAILAEGAPSAELRRSFVPSVSAARNQSLSQGNTRRQE